jgi:hypothetical protein
MVATGQPVARKQTMTAEVEPADLKYFAISEDGAPYMDLTGNATKRGAITDAAMKAAGWETRYIPWTAPKIENPLDAAKRGEAILKEAAEQLAAKRALVNADLDADYAAFLADPTQRGRSEYNHIELMGRTYAVSSSSYYANVADATTHPGVKDGSIRKAIEARDAADAREREAKATEAKAKAAEAKAAKEAEEAAKEEAKKEFRKSWIAQYGTDAQKQQYADNLFCKGAIHDMIADHAFKGLHAFAMPEFCDDSDCPCGSRNESCIPERQYALWLERKAALPEATATFRSFRECLKTEDGYYDGPKAAPRQYVADLSIVVGPFTFERTVLLG